MDIVYVDRTYKKSKYTIGKLIFKGETICNTVEDTDRGLTSDSSLSEIDELKKAYPGEVAIPRGRYKLRFDIVSPKFSNFIKYPYARAIGGRMPRVMNVPGYEGILIHPGKFAKDSLGCIIVGKNTVVGGVTNSQYWFNIVYHKLLPYKSDLWIEIK